MKKNKIYFLSFDEFSGRKKHDKLQKVYALYEYDAVAESIICKWLNGFRSGNFDLKDRKHCNRFADITKNRMETLIKIMPI